MCLHGQDSNFYTIGVQVIPNVIQSLFQIYAISMHATLTFMQYVRLKREHSHGTHASNYVTPTRLHDVCSVNLSMTSEVTVGRDSTVHQCNSNFYKKLMIRFLLHRIHVYRTHLSFAGISPYSRRRSHTTSPTPC